MKEQKDDFLFNKSNYILMAVGVLLVIAGFVLMSGGNSDPSTFNPDEVYSARRITVAPILILLGFAVEFFAIFKK